MEEFDPEKVYTYNFGDYCLHKIVGHIDTDESGVKRLKTIGYGYLGIPLPLPWWYRLIYFCVIFTAFLIFCGAGYLSTIIEKKEAEEVEVEPLGAPGVSMQGSQMHASS